MKTTRKSARAGIIIFCAFILLTIPVSAFGQNSLLIQADVQSRGMGEVATPLPDNPMGFTSNPALLTQTHTAFARFSKGDWLPEIPGEDFDVYAGAAGLSDGPWLNFGLAFERFDFGRQQLTDDNGVPIYSINPNDKTLCVGYAAAPIPWFSAGVNFKWVMLDHIIITPGDDTFSTFGFDIGLFFHDLWPNMTYTEKSLDFNEYSTGFGRFLKRQSHPRSRGMSFGIAVQNIGPNFSIGDTRIEIPLPHMLRLGAAWRIMDTDAYGMMVALDLNRFLLSPIGTIYKHYDIHIGMELELARSLDMRIGYVRLAYGRPHYPTVGASFGVDRLHADISYIPKSSVAYSYEKTLFFGLTLDL